jgi:hypothetical protein
MHCYRRSNEEGAWLYTVGYYEPRMDARDLGNQGLFYLWVPVEDTTNEDEARALVNYLNGGDGRKFAYTK